MCNFCDSQSCTGQCRNGWPFNRPFYNPPFTTPFNRECRPPVPPVPPWPCPTCKPCVQNGCLTQIITDCVFTTKAYPCIGVASGTSLTTVLSALDTIVCNLAPPNCGTWINLPLQNPGGAPVDIDLPLFEFGATLTPFTSTPQYRLDGCGNVSLRGFVVIPPINFVASVPEFTTLFDTNIAVPNRVPIAILPVGARPKSMMITTVFGQVSFNYTPSTLYTTYGLANVWLIINTDGTVFFGATAGVGGIFITDHNPHSFKISIDNVQFSIT